MSQWGSMVLHTLEAKLFTSRPNELTSSCSLVFMVTNQQNNSVLEVEKFNCDWTARRLVTEWRKFWASLESSNHKAYWGNFCLLRSSIFNWTSGGFILQFHFSKRFCVIFWLKENCAIQTWLLEFKWIFISEWRIFVRDFHRIFNEMIFGWFSNLNWLLDLWLALDKLQLRHKLHVLP